MSAHENSALGRLRRTIGPRLPATPGVAAVFLGDLLVVGALLAAGLSRHGTDPIANPLYALDTAAPFVIAWLVLAPVAGFYLRETLASYRQTVAVVVAGWAGIAVLGSLLRSTAYFHGGAGTTFLLVQVGFGLVLLVPWRLAVTALVRR